MSFSSILRRGPHRFAVLIAFIILAAALARLADLATGWILAVIAIAWVLSALIERSVHRAAMTAKDARAGGAVAGAAAPVGAPLAAATPVPTPVTTARVVPEPVVPARVTAAPAARPRPTLANEADLWLDGDAEIDPGPAPGVPWSEPVRAAAPEPVLEPASELVLPPPPRLVASSSLPRGSWNLWELEGIAHDASGADAARDEERLLILMYLRGFASAEGVLGPEFDDLVRESFGDILPPR